MLQTIKGNLITLAKQKRFDGIAHGCNCRCNMGAGIALQIKREFPEAYKTDCNTAKDDHRKLGSYSHVYLPEYELFVFNLYTQFNYGRGQINADYNAIQRCMKRLYENHHDLVIGMPKIGAGLAGGDWSIIEPIIEQYLPNTIIVEYDGS